MEDAKMTLVVGRDKVGVWDTIYPMLSKADDMTMRLVDYVSEIIDDDSFEIWLGLRDSGEIVYCTLCEVCDEYYYIHKHASDDAGCYDWNKIIETIEERAKVLGKKRVAILGRKGWSRILKDYKVKKYFYVKKVTE